MRASVCVWDWQRVSATASTRIMGNHMAAIDREDVVLRITKEGGGDRYGCWVIILCRDLYACYFTFRCTRQSCGFAPGFLWNGWLFMMHQKRFVYLWVFHSLFFILTQSPYGPLRVQKDVDLGIDSSSPDLRNETSRETCHHPRWRARAMLWLAIGFVRLAKWR